MDDLTPQQHQAFKRIELISLWEGRLNTQHLIDSLGIQRTTASRLLREYQARCPNNLTYNNTSKGYEPTEHFSAQYSRGQLDDYLALNQGEHTQIHRLASGQQNPNPAHVRAIIQAIKNNSRLDIAYASLKAPQGEERIISPHSLINDGHRWHVRAWCEKSQGYRDFVLSRIRQVFGLEGQAQQNQEQDQDWQRWVRFSVEPDQRLSTDQKELIALDYDMEKNSAGIYQRHYQVRAALVLYWLQYLRLDRYRESPEAQQIILSPESRAAVKPYLPD